MSDTKQAVLIHGAWSRGEQLALTRAAFEERGYTAHTPTLRHHELPLNEGATKIASLSLGDYTDDLVGFVNSLDSPPLLVGHSMGGLLAQLVAARTRHAGLVAACPAPAAGIFGTTLTNLRMSLPSFLRARPWAKPVRPPTSDRFRRRITNTQTEEVTREVYSDLVCESGRAYCEMGLAVTRLSKATRCRFRGGHDPGARDWGPVRPHRASGSRAPDRSQIPARQLRRNSRIRSHGLLWCGSTHHHGSHRRLDG
jgi:pimeloyl-ACP methyl ester carboxylesterase